MIGAWNFPQILSIINQMLLCSFLKFNIYENLFKNLFIPTAVPVSFASSYDKNMSVGFYEKFNQKINIIHKHGRAWTGWLATHYQKNYKNLNCKIKIRGQTWYIIQNSRPWWRSKWKLILILKKTYSYNEKKNIEKALWGTLVEKQFVVMSFMVKHLW